MIDLQPFCMNETAYSGRYDMSKPWGYGPWHYATDGRLIVRVPGGLANKPYNAPTAAHLFRDFNAVLCNEELPQWDGTNYEHREDCNNPQCHDGKISGGKNQCETCEGRGWCLEWMSTTVVIHGFNFRGTYLQKIHALPGVLGYVRTLPKSCAELNFIFDGGGQGLLMNTTSLITPAGIQLAR